MKILILLISMLILPQRTYAHSGSVFKVVFGYLPAIIPFLVLVFSKIKWIMPKRRK